jgi:hypothetical protein
MRHSTRLYCGNKHFVVFLGESKLLIVLQEGSGRFELKLRYIQ